VFIVNIKLVQTTDGKHLNRNMDIIGLKLKLYDTMQM